MKQASSLSKKFSNLVFSIDKTRRKIEISHQNNELTTSDVERVYDGLFLNVVGSFENMIEELFYGLALGKHRVSYNVRTKVSFQNEPIARSVILNRQSYSKWLPIKETTDTAKMYFHDKNPFNQLTSSEVSLLNEVVNIRNAVAHKSGYALKKFHTSVISTRPITRREKTPSGYLRGNFRTHPNQTRFENLVFSLVLIADKLTK